MRLRSNIAIHRDMRMELQRVLARHRHPAVDDIDKRGRVLEQTQASPVERLHPWQRSPARHASGALPPFPPYARCVWQQRGNRLPAHQASRTTRAKSQGENP